MESNPLQKLVRVLAGMHQEQAQAMLAMRSDQEHHLQALQKAQVEDRQVLRALGYTMATLSSNQTGDTAMEIMGPQEDAEEYLRLFEQTAEERGWPEGQWGARLLPLLSGEALSAAQRLSSGSMLEYPELRRVILQSVVRTPEQCRRRFRTLSFNDFDRPFAFAQRLKDACWRWLLAEERDAEAVVDLVVLEQFIAQLPTGTAEWVQRHSPESLDEAITLAEDHLMGNQEKDNAPTSFPSTPSLPSHSVSVPAVAVMSRENKREWSFCWRCGKVGHFRYECLVQQVDLYVLIPNQLQVIPDQDGTYLIEVNIKRVLYQALVDPNCSKTTVNQSLIRGKAWEGVQNETVQVRDGDVVILTIKFRKYKSSVEALINSHIAHPMILGNDWLEIGPLLRAMKVDEATCGRTKDKVAFHSPSTSEDVWAEPPTFRKISAKDFLVEQKRDKTLHEAFDQVKVNNGQSQLPQARLRFPYFAIVHNRLFQVKQELRTNETFSQLLVPLRRRNMLIQLAHHNPMAGHLGLSQTLIRVMARFYWPGIRGDVRKFCSSCRKCRLVTPPASSKVPFYPLPLNEVLFARVALDLVGPLEQSERGYRFLVVVVDCATRYPEAIPLRNITEHDVADALYSIISRVGVPEEILTDQSRSFMSHVLRELSESSEIKAIRVSPYHPQRDELVEGFTRNLNTMIGQFVHRDARTWEEWIEPLLFSIREVPQTTTGFSPFELMYGRKPRSILDLIRENWEEGTSDSDIDIHYAVKMRAKLHTLGKITQADLLVAQERQLRLRDKDVPLRVFAPGDRVLILLPMSSSKMLAKWQGPFEVTRRVKDAEYEVVRTFPAGTRHVYHLNLLKPWEDETEGVELGPEERLQQTGSLTPVLDDENLSPECTEEAPLQFTDEFLPELDDLDVIDSRKDSPRRNPTRNHPYRLPKHIRTRGGERGSGYTRSHGSRGRRDGYSRP